MSRRVEGVRNWCRTCRRDFASVKAFDAHRTGLHAFTFREGLAIDPPREDGRRCLDEAEFADAGLGLDAHGRWRVVADVARIRARFAEVPESVPLNAQDAQEPVSAASDKEAA